MRAVLGPFPLGIDGTGDSTSGVAATGNRRTVQPGHTSIGRSSTDRKPDCSHPGATLDHRLSASRPHAPIHCLGNRGQKLTRGAAHAAQSVVPHPWGNPGRPRAGTALRPSWPRRPAGKQTSISCSSKEDGPIRGKGHMDISRLSLPRGGCAKCVNANQGRLLPRRYIGGRTVSQHWRSSEHHDSQAREPPAQVTRRSGMLMSPNRSVAACRCNTRPRRGPGGASGYRPKLSSVCGVASRERYQSPGQMQPAMRGAMRKFALTNRQMTYCPPFAVSVEPVINPASSDARKTTQRAISSGSPRRPTGICGRMFFSSRSFGTACTISVLM